MITYASRFRVSEALNQEVFITNIVEWNQHGKYKIDGLQAEGTSFHAGTDKNNLTVDSMKSHGITAARMHTETPSGIWNTDIILNEQSHTLTIRVDKSLSETTENVNTDGFFPNIVIRLIDKGLLGESCGFPITYKPIENADRETLEQAIAATDEYALPLVYLSSKSKISAEVLAKKMAGLGVVVCDKNDVLAETFPEPITIFYPHSNTEPKSLGEYPQHREIRWLLLEFLNRKNYTPLETWHGIQIEKTNRRNVELLDSMKAQLAENNALKERANDTEFYMEMVNHLDSVLANLKKQNEEIMSAKNKLSEDLYLTQNENLRLKEKLDGMKKGDAPLLVRGGETDYYPDEQYEIVMDCLKDYAGKSVKANTRRHDILKSVIERNPVKGTPAEFKEAIKKGLKGYTKFDSRKIKDTMKKTNIQIVNHSGHYKIALNGDARYQVEAAATCSDGVCGGKNLSSEINEIMF